MTGKNSYFTINDFINQGIFDEPKTECKINNLFYRKGDSFEHYQIKSVLEICNKYNSLNINTLIVKSQEHLTVWIEEKFKTISQVEVQDLSKLETPSHHQSLPTKKVTKKYRGQEYLEEVIDWSAVQQIQQNKPRRKYRGQYID